MKDKIEKMAFTIYKSSLLIILISMIGLSLMVFPVIYWSYIYYLGIDPNINEFFLTFMPIIGATLILILGYSMGIVKGIVNTSQDKKKGIQTIAAGQSSMCHCCDRFFDPRDVVLIDHQEFDQVCKGCLKYCQGGRMSV